MTYAYPKFCFDTSGKTGAGWHHGGVADGPVLAGLMQPPHRQILQPAERPAADPHRFVIGDLEPAGTGEQCRQCDVRDHGARGPGAGTEMRAGAERDTLGRITPHVELVGALKVLLVTIGGAEHEEYAFIGF